jgi:hypothetical protein
MGSGQSNPESAEAHGFRKMDHANSLINAAPERQPYRNEPEIRNLFKRLAVPMKKLEASGSCYIVQI